MSKQLSDPLILLDADVVRHFINGSEIHRLASIYPKRFVMLDIVRDELCLSMSLRTIVTNFLTMTKVPVITFPIDRNVMKEYAQLKKNYGVGESACMAVAKYQQQFIASSNLKDIKSYCVENGITYLTTMDILMEALKKNVFTETDCDQFIVAVLSKGSKLPCNSIAEYRKIIAT
jgi:predicted nucleic acid-binding protein